MMVSVAAAAAMTSCQRENLEPEVQQQETIEVKVSLCQQTKGFTDLEGITWEVGDQIKYAGGLEVISEPLTAEQISEDGYTASFTFPASLIEVDRTGWFCSTKNHPGNYTEVEFTLGQGTGNIITQEVAGQMNSRYLFLHSGSGLIRITAGETPEFNMDIAGTIFRAIPYTNTYNDEKVLSVKLASNTKLVGTVAYDRGAGTYRGVNDINWQANNYVKVELGTPLSLEGVTASQNSKGVYIAVAATKADLPLQGYQYVVETDKATYTFDAMDKTLAVGENQVVNVLLNLDNAVRSFEGGLLQYIGDLGLASNTLLPADGVTNYDGGYWYAQVKMDGTEDWVNKDGADNSHFYSGVKFTVTDAATGAPVNWLRVVYGGNGGSHWLLSADLNSGEQRSAIVTAAFPDVKGYVVTDECKTKVITVTQAAAGSVKNVTYGSTSLPANITLGGEAHNNVNVGYCLLVVDGVEDRNWAGIYSGIEFKCVSEADAAAGNYENEVDWLSCTYANNGGNIYDCVWWVSAAENTSSSPRTAVIVAVFPEDERYAFPAARQLVVTQNPSNDGTIYDPASAANMWLTMNVEEMMYYYAPGWSVIDNPTMVQDGNHYTITLPAATYEKWQAQIAFRTDMSSSADKMYDFYCVLNSTKDHNNVTIKLVETGNDGHFYFESSKQLKAGEDLVFKMPSMTGRNMSKISLFFDFGGNAADTQITVRDIIFQEHQQE